MLALETAVFVTLNIIPQGHTTTQIQAGNCHAFSTENMCHKYEEVLFSLGYKASCLLGSEDI
jgi:hypothetical protein